MTVEFLWWRGCPSWEEVLAMLRKEMVGAGLDPGEITMLEIDTDAEADRSDFPGSPTIRIDGADVQDPGDNPIGLACRVYRLRDGRTSALPDPADIREALVEATTGGD